MCCECAAVCLFLYMISECDHCTYCCMIKCRLFLSDGDVDACTVRSLDVRRLCQALLP